MPIDCTYCMKFRASYVCKSERIDKIDCEALGEVGRRLMADCPEADGRPGRDESDWESEHE